MRMFKERKGGILLFVLLLSSLIVSAQGEVEACFADRPCEVPEQLAGERGFFENLRQLPTTQLRLHYVADDVVLPNFGWISLGFLFVAVLAWLYFFKKRRKRWHWVKPSVVVAVLLLVSLGLLYSLAVYYHEGAEEGIIVCKSPEECSIAMHVHADVEVVVCGMEHIFGFEKGDLSKAHTHKERNKIHWHDLERVDPQTKEILDPSELRVGAFFGQMGERFTSECLLDKCDGDVCPGSSVPGKVSMSVNGVPNAELERYVWKDNDKIVVRFE